MPPDVSPDFQVHPPVPTGGSKALAYTAMGLGIGAVALCILWPLALPLGLAAVITGGIALAKRKPGRTQAWVGVGCGSLGMVLSVAMVFVLLAALAQARQVARLTVSMTNAREIGMALMAYTTDYRDQFPEPGADLTRRLNSYLPSPKVFESPSDRSVVPGYIYVPRGKFSQANPRDVLLYENPATPAFKWAVLYVDGHVEAKSKQELEAIIAGLGTSK